MLVFSTYLIIHFSSGSKWRRRALGSYNCAGKVEWISITGSVNFPSFHSHSSVNLLMTAFFHAKFLSEVSCLLHKVDENGVKGLFTVNLVKWILEPPTHLNCQEYQMSAKRGLLRVIKKSPENVHQGPPDLFLIQSDVRHFQQSAFLHWGLGRTQDIVYIRNDQLI